MTNQLREREPGSLVRVQNGSIVGDEPNELAEGRISYRVQHLDEFDVIVKNCDNLTECILIKVLQVGLLR